ncbi:armadillo-type protein [Dichotomocladium elegans]|nr:armadillo-type protein [Dichotomocladium elegans]
MDQAVFETLVNVHNADGAIRSAAEKRLEELAASSPEFPVSLTRLTISREIPIPQRQLAALTLKAYVASHWSPRNDDTFKGPEPSPEYKKAVRELIIHGLTDPEKKIRVVSAYVVSKIAHEDFPEDWPNLFDILLSYLKSNSADSVHGAMHVMLEMVKRDISIQQLPQIAPVLVPQLFTILTSDNVYSFRTRGRAVGIFNSCVEMLVALRDDNPQAADEYVGPILPQWIQAFHTILTHHVQGDVEKATEEYGLKMEVVKCISKLSGAFSKFIFNSLPQLLEPIWNDMYSLKDRYVAELVLDSSDVAETFQDSDSNEIGFLQLLYVLFEFIEATCTKKAVRHLFVNNGAPTPFFEQVLYVVIVYLQITQEQVETWLSNVNQYVADEDDYTFSFTARVAGWDLLAVLQETFPDPYAAALWAATQRHFTESNNARVAGDANWWKIQEACLCAMGRSADDMMQAIKDGSRNLRFDIKSLFDHVIIDSIRATGCPFLQGRALVFASELVDILPGELASEYVRVSAEALRSPESSIPVKISALRALNNYCQQLDPEFSAPQQMAIMECICQLLPEATEEALMLLLQSLCAVVKIKPEITAQYEQVLTTAVLDTWKRFPTDSIIASYILDIIEHFARIPQYAPALYHRCLPFLDNVFKTTSDQTVIASAIDILTAMIRYAQSPLPNEFTERMFPTVMQLGWNSTDEDVLQSVQECLKHYIIKDSNHIIQWNDGSGKSGLDYVVHFVAKLLQTSTSSQSLFVGDLIVTLIQNAGHNIANVLPELLNAVLARLENADNQPFIQSLVMVFAHLIINQQDTVYQFLCNTAVNGKSGLEVLMKMWCDYFDSFSGYYRLKVSAIALSKVFLITDPRLQSLTVRGDIVADPNEGIVTRSKAKRKPEQYRAIPVHAKIIRLLVGDLANTLVPENDSITGLDDEDNEWETLSDSGAGMSKAEFTFLSDLAADVDEEDEENNEALKDDPIYQTDLRAYLVDFFRNCSAHNVNNFMEICHVHLNDSERESLEMALKN